MTTIHTVLVCDDRPELRGAITAVLQDVPGLTVVGEATDAASCLATVQLLLPGILILDYSIPGGGPDVVRRATVLNPGMHIIVFSGHGESRVQQEMLEAGADQYVVKTGRILPLLHAVRRALTERGTVPTGTAIPGQQLGLESPLGTPRNSENRGQLGDRLDLNRPAN